MREIRFRGKREDSGEWVYGGFYHGIMSETDNPFSLDNARIKTIILQEGTYYHVTSETVGQYTGLTDKNGKRIFEGDIIDTHTKWKRGYVSFYQGIFKVTSGISLQSFCPECETLGNIYDNPEMLKKD